MNTPPFSASLVIPLYNNEKTLRAQLTMCNSILKNICTEYEIIVVNDASTDTSKDILKKYFSNKNHFRIYTHNKNQGIAQTILELYKKASLKYVVLYSVDGDWNPNDIENLLSKAHKTQSDIIIGKRNKQDYTVYRKVISFFYNLLPKILFNTNTFDAGSIKIFKRNIFSETKILSTSLFFEAEFIIKAQKKGYKITSLNVSYKKKHKTSGTAGKISNVLHCIYDVVRVRLETEKQ